MVKRRNSKGKQKKEQEVFDSDDERAYENEKTPNRNDDDFYHDEVDEFHTQKEKILLDRAAALEPAGSSSDEEDEVLGLGSDDSSNDEEIEDYKERLKKLRRHGIKEGVSDSDDEDEKQDKGDGLPDKKAWGKRRRKYYRSDSESADEASGSELEADEMEEQEALAIQKKMAEELNDMDFGLDIFKDMKKTDQKETEEKIQTDVSQLPRSEKLKLLKKDSPEVLELIDDYKTKMTELTTRLLPVNELVSQGRLGQSSGTDYIHTKVSLYLNYCVNVSFYLMLKAKHTPQIHSHPVVNRLVQYRNLMKQLKPADEKMESEITSLVEKITIGEVPEIQSTASSVTARLLNKAREHKAKADKSQRKKKRELPEAMSDSEGEDISSEGLEKGGRTWGRKRKVDDLTSGEREADELYKAIKSGRKDQEEDIDYTPETAGDGEVEENVKGNGYDEEMDEDGKRAVTYQILKNKGLRVYKKKENRNPRLKHRMKYRKAKIRRKGQIREVRTELTQYGGELSGIRAGIKRGIKIK